MANQPIADTSLVNVAQFRIGDIKTLVATMAIAMVGKLVVKL